MAHEVKFLYGTEAKYQSLGTYDDDAFYRTENNLYLGHRKVTIEAGDVDTATIKDGTILKEDLNPSTYDEIVEDVKDQIEAADPSELDSWFT